MKAPLLLAVLAVLSASPSRADEPPKFKFTRTGGGSSGGSSGDSCSPNQQGKDRAWVRRKLVSVGSDCKVAESEFYSDADFNSALDYEGCRMRNAFTNTYGAINNEYKKNPSFKLNQAYLTNLHNLIAKGWGSEGAEIGMRVAVVPFLKKATPDGLEYLATLSGVPAKFPLLARHRGGASMFYDCNPDGAAGTADAIVVYGNPGDQPSEVKVMSAADAKVFHEPSLSAFDARVSRAFKSAASKLIGHAKWGSTGGGFSAPAEFWTAFGYGLGMKDGKKPADAMASLQANDYAVECVCGMQVFLHAAVLELLGADNFNKLYGDDLGVHTGFEAGTGKMVPGGIAPYLDEAGDATKPADEAFYGDLKPGTVVYWNNPPAQGAWHGENAIYVGIKDYERWYLAHPFGLVNESDLVQKLKDHGGSTPWMHQATTRLKDSLANKMP